MKTPIQQATGLFNFWVGLTGFSATGLSGNITTALTTAANTAGRAGVAVPVQQATITTQGFVVSGLNKVLVFDSATKERIKDANQNAVYARLTFATSVYTVTYFVLSGSVETAVTLPVSTIDLFIPYSFEIGVIPADFAVRIAQTYAGDDLGILPTGGTTINTFAEILPVTALNTINSLTKTPFPASAVKLHVFGITNSPLTGDFTLGGAGNKVITWLSVAAGHSLNPGDKVLADYPTQE